MKKLTILYKDDPGNDSDIIGLEDKYQIKLPGYLKEFIKNYGGTETQEKSFYIGDRKYLMGFFLAVVSDKNASMDLIMPAIIDPEEGIGRNDLIPFAIDPGGRPFYVSIGEADNGIVYKDNVGLGGEALKKMSDSFEAFIDSLRSE